MLELKNCVGFSDLFQYNNIWLSSNRSQKVHNEMPQIKLSTRRTPTGLLAVVLLAVVATTALDAQIALQAQLVTRPLTAGEIAKYNLPATTEMSGGLTTVGVGQAEYLDAEVNIAEPASDISGVAWTLTTRPTGSQAAIATSPLGATVPVYE